MDGRPERDGRRAGRNCDCALLHDLVVVYGISDVDICFEGKVRHGRVEVEDIRRSGW